MEEWERVAAEIGCDANRVRIQMVTFGWSAQRVRAHHLAGLENPDPEPIPEPEPETARDRFWAHMEGMPARPDPITVQLHPDHAGRGYAPYLDRYGFRKTYRTFVRPGDLPVGRGPGRQEVKVTVDSQDLPAPWRDAARGSSYFVHTAESREWYEVAERLADEYVAEAGRNAHMPPRWWIGNPTWRLVGEVESGGWEQL